MAYLLVLTYGEANRPWYPRHIEGLLLAVFCPSSLRRMLVKSNASAWSAGMQLTGQ